ncbi:MAG: 50S ribosomal protein L22 [Sedimentisphaerales bacterium]|nr:50S ribosomal protein L22 [Sedimentisphaerales bacterium]
MLSANKLDNLIKKQGKNVAELAAAITRPGFDEKQAAKAIKNWRKGLIKPVPRGRDIESLASALGVDAINISQWRSTIKYAPISPTKARLVTQLVAGRDVQESLDMLRFTGKRAADMVQKAIKSAVANADEDAADVENLYICQARVDCAGIRVGTKRWIPKDRGRAHSIRKMGSHIHITVTEI